MKHFVTLFPPAKNVHLVKDVGQIPYQLQKHFNYRSTLVCYAHGQYPYSTTEVPGLEIEFITDRGRLFYWENAFVGYVINNARSIDVLNLYHLTQESMLYGLLYKILNPNGILYLKLDMDVNHYRENGIRFSDHNGKEAFHQWVYSKFRKKLDIASTETQKGLRLLQQLDRDLYKKTILLPSGLNIGRIDEYLDPDLYGQKENCILTVGRIGSPAKNSELLLEALSRLKLKDWKAYFVGPIADAFQPKIAQFFQDNPELQEHVIFTGPIVDREKLWTYYAKAKIFCIPSLWESFAIAICEAQHAGNYIIGTDTISSIEELTASGKYGEIIESGNISELTEAIRKCMQPDFYDASRMRAIKNHAKHYNWRSILPALDAEITKHWD